MDSLYWVWVLILGILIGWIIEWLIDRFMRSGRVCSDYEETLQADLNKLRSENSALSADVNKLNSRVAKVGDLETQLATYKSDHKSLLADFDAQASKLKKANISLAASRKELGSLKGSSAQAADIEGRLKKSNTAYARLKADFESRGAELSGLKARLADKDAEIGKLSGKVKEFEGGFKKLGLGAAGGAMTAAGLFAALRGRFDDKDEVQNVSADLKADVDAKSAEIDRLSAELTALRGDLKARDHELNTLRAQTADVDVSAVQGELEANASEATRLAAELEASSAEIDRLKAELSQRDTDLQKMQSDFEPTLALVGDVDVMRAQLEQRDLEIAEMRGLLEAREQELGELTYELDDKDGKWASVGLLAAGGAGGGLLARLHGMRGEAEAKNAQLANSDAEISRLNARIAELEAAAAAVSVTVVETSVTTIVEPDDLTRIHQIGPKISSILNQNGITTFAELAAADPDYIGRILDDQPGDKYRFATPEFRAMWQEQARAAVAGDWVLFDEIPRRYNFVSTPVEPTEPDDLTRIHGIGPKIASILNENGITTFVALAATAPEDIGKLLDAQPGDKFRLATDEVRESWRAQAKAAVAEDWERFKHLAAKFKKLTGSK